MQRRALVRYTKKFLHDLALVAYDDLTFTAMSLPRLAAIALTIVVIVAWYAEQFMQLPFQDFTSLTNLCLGIWGAYAFKKWTGRASSQAPPPPQDESTCDGTKYDTGFEPAHMHTEENVERGEN